MRGLDGKVVIVAGAGSGIGAAAAVRLAEERASVVVADIHADNSDRVAATITEGGDSAIAVAFDIADTMPGPSVSRINALIRPAEASG